ncbi:MAG: DmsC/YnfH family molybdoenzyme membrane anchor subunit [Verrucomicrobiales bacterium]
MATGRENQTLIDELIDEQRQLTAVERFAQKHERSDLPLQSRYYKDLIPLTKPSPGQQYAFEVDLDKCSACKACVTACHNLNGLDEDETWRSVGFLIGTHGGGPVQQPVTTACHHCVDPGCLNGCPVLAYEKDPVTGIVKHLDDQCIGCQYCVLKCPYDVPKYSSKRGIVRKCDMCSSRLAEGEAPACVQACPNEAIKITLVNKEMVAEAYSTQTGDGANLFLPGSPQPEITRPSTRYVSAKGSEASLRPADHDRIIPEKNHLPLVWMLVLTQGAVGLYVLKAFAVFFGAPLSKHVTLLALGLCLAGLAVSVLHLGRPHLAWKAFLGIRKSWLSREIVVFGGFAPLAIIVTALDQGWVNLPGSVLLVSAAALIGLGSVFCSVMVYADTKKEFWKVTRTVPNFFGTTLLLALGFGSALGGNFVLNTVLVPLWITGAIVKGLLETENLKSLSDPALTPLKRSALLMIGVLRIPAILRLILLLAGSVILPSVYLVTDATSFLLAGALIAFLGELVERSLFFQAASEAKMPGGLR